MWRGKESLENVHSIVVVSPIGAQCIDTNVNDCTLPPSKQNEQIQLFSLGAKGAQTSGTRLGGESHLDDKQQGEGKGEEGEDDRENPEYDTAARGCTPCCYHLLCLIVCVNIGWSCVCV